MLRARMRWRCGRSRYNRKGTLQALSVIASSDVAFHRFPAALAAERAALQGRPVDDNARAQIASILMEIGRYDEAERILFIRSDPDPNPTWMSIRARYNELDRQPRRSARSKWPRPLD